MSDDRILSPEEAARRHCLDVDVRWLERVRAEEAQCGADLPPLPPTPRLPTVAHIRIVVPQCPQWPSHATNPSITYHRGDLLVAVRVVEHGLDWLYRRSRTAIGRVVEGWRTTGWHFVDEGPAADGILCEDARLISADDRLYLIASRRLYGNVGTLGTVVLALDDALDVERFYPLQPRDAAVADKNLSPCVRDGTLGLLYTVDPPQVLAFDHATGAVSPDVSTLEPLRGGSARGGSQLITRDDGTWLSVVHSCRINQQRLPDYAHHFAVLAPNLDRVHVGRPWKFTAARIEFVAGLALVPGGGGVAISYGLEDCEARLALVTDETVRELVAT